MTTDIETTLAELKRYPLLESLPVDGLRKILPQIRLRTLQKDEVLIFEGGSSSYLYFVKEGWLKAEKTSPEGRQQTLRMVGPGDVINELAVFSESCSEVSVIAMENTRIYQLDGVLVELLLQEYPLFSRAVINRLAKRIEHLLTLVEDLALFSVRSRLARYLLKESQNGVFTRHAWQSQAEMAAQIGTVLDVLNRTLTAFQGEGLIVIGRDEIILLDQPRLRQIGIQSVP